MKPFMKSAVVSLVAISFLALALSACSMSSSVPRSTGGTSLTQSRSLARATSDNLLFVANGRSSIVDIYDKEAPNAHLGQITDGLSGPNGMVVDAAGDLFVANVDNQTVTEYPPGSTKPSRTYTKGFNQRLTNPLNVTVGTDGTLYLVNYIGNGSQVLEYPSGSVKPSLAIAVNGGAEGLALDTSNNLFVSYNGQAGGRILKFAPGSTTGTDLGISLGFAGGLAFDGNANLVACDQTAPAIDIFPPGATKPSRTITHGLRDPYHIAFGQHFHRLYVADSVADNLPIFSYPAGTILSEIHRKFTAYGVAVNPAAPL
jgi:hypothetical protein